METALKNRRKVIEGENALYDYANLMIRIDRFSKAIDGAGFGMITVKNNMGVSCKRSQMIELLHKCLTKPELAILVESEISRSLNEVHGLPPVSFVSFGSDFNDYDEIQARKELIFKENNYTLFYFNHGEATVSKALTPKVNYVTHYNSLEKASLNAMSSKGRFMTLMEKFTKDELCIFLGVVLSKNRR